MVEVPARGALNPEKHMYEEIFLVVEGRGSTEVWQDGDTRKHMFEWQKGSMFSIPMNAMHRIVNATSSPAAAARRHHGAERAQHDQQRRGGVRQPVSCSATASPVATTSSSTSDDIEPDPVRGLAMRRTNFIPDVINCDLPLDNRRSVGYRRVEPFMTNNQFYFWIGQHENGRYSKVHAHTCAAVLICLKGKGYTYSWPERCGETPWKDGFADQVRRVDYEPFGLVTAAPGRRALVSRALFASGNEPFRLTAWFGPHNPGRDPGPPGEKHIDYTGMDLQEGGTAIPYWMEDPYIRKEYEETLAKAGIKSRMEAAFYEVPEKYKDWSRTDRVVPTSAAGVNGHADRRHPV